MKRHLRIGSRVSSDLAEIWDEIAKHSPLNADRFCDELLKTCETVAEFPLAGRPRTEVPGGYRGWPHGHYLLLYRVFGDAVEIVRIVHGAREIRKVLKSGEL